MVIQYSHKVDNTKEMNMSQSVSGSYTSAVSANRVRIPAKYRGFLGEKFVATVGSDGCFLLMPSENKEKILGKYINVDDPIMSPMKRTARLFNQLTADIELDVQGRITINDQLKKICTGLAQPTEAIVFCGMGEYIEAWPQQVYDKVFGGDVTADDFDSLIANLKAQLGIED